MRNKNEGSIFVSAVIIFCVFFAAILILSKIILTTSTKDKMKYYADNVARSTAALALGQGNAEAELFANQMLGNFISPTTTSTNIFSCPPSICVTVTINYTEPLSGLQKEIISNAMSYDISTNHIGANLIP